MSYKNIVFIKLEKRLFDDPRWYMLSEKAQLNYIKFILFAASNWNKIPINLKAIKLAFKTSQTEDEIQKTINEIQCSFPKFMKNNNFYYFKGFHEKTNYIKKNYPREIPRKSPENPKLAVDKEKKRIDKEKIKKIFDFESVWVKYPKKLGKGEARGYFNMTVKTEEDYLNIQRALDNYILHTKRNNYKKMYIKDGNNWFSDWESWVDYAEEVPECDKVKAELPTRDNQNYEPEEYKELTDTDRQEVSQLVQNTIKDLEKEPL